jgi:4-amino-4-deoxy-L-arabinose transferase-like glycosyltransferase
VHDISLAFFITLALTLFYLGYENEKRRSLYFLAGYAAMGFAVLAKGPVGFLLPTAIIGLFIVLKKQLPFLREMQVGWGMLVVLAVAAPWYIMVSFEDPDYVGYFFLKQNFGNFFSADVRHPEPIYYYIPVLMGGMFPWSILLPLALFRGIRARKSANKDGMLFTLLWVAVVFVFFSLANSKLGTYLLPLFPAAALLVGTLLNNILINSSDDLDKGLIYSYLHLVIILPLALIYIILFPPPDFMAETGIELKWIYFPAGGLVACCFLTMGLAIRKKYRAFIGSMVGTVMTVLVFSLIFLVPPIEPYRSSKYLAQKIDKLLDPTQNLVFYLKARETFLFYTQRKATELETLSQLSKYMASDRQVFCIFKMDDWQDAAKLHKKMHIVVWKGNKLIASNKKHHED